MTATPTTRPRPAAGFPSARPENIDMMPAADAKLSVLVPAYNEEHTVGEVIARVLALGPVVKEVVVVDDGSKDGTADAVRRAASGQPKVRFFSQPVNQGKTAAIRRALEECTGEIVIIQDADAEYDPAEIPDVINPILQGHADVVYGSRFLVREGGPGAVLPPLPGQRWSHFS